MSATPSPVPDSGCLDPVASTQRLVRFDTTNPPGNEGRCIEHINPVLDRSGIQNYGLPPMLPSAAVDFATTVHDPNERVPVSAISFGADAIYSLLQRYGRSPERG